MSRLVRSLAGRVARMITLAGALGACRPADDRAAGAPARPGAATASTDVVSPSAGPSTTRADDVPPLDSATVEDTVRAIIARHRWTKLPPACVALVPVPEDPPYSFDAREVHDTACGGDPNTAPRLFSIRWDTTGRVVTDALGQINGTQDTLTGPTYRPRRRAAP